jgi:hypothetical protein
MSTPLPRARRSKITAAPPCQGRCQVYATQRSVARCECNRAGDDRAHEVLATYLDDLGRQREIVTCLAEAGSQLVMDRDRLTRGDRRLLAHLAVDEPAGNARLICDLYLAEAPLGRCRAVVADDLSRAVASELAQQASVDFLASAATVAQECCEAHGNRYLLATVFARRSMPELRWCMRSSGVADAPRRSVSVRDVVGALESYEPVRTLTAAAIHRHRDDPTVSVSTLGTELERLNGSRIVLNRGLREAVVAAVAASELSMSEIALRCGRLKRDRRGTLSGETTWLARRLGLVCEGGAGTPSPWVHSDVLALIARRGLGIAPREVEIA